MINHDDEFNDPRISVIPIIGGMVISQRDRITELEAMLEELEWSYWDDADGYSCPSCGGYPENKEIFGRFGHTFDCKLNNLLKK